MAPDFLIVKTSKKHISSNGTALKWRSAVLFCPCTQAGNTFTQLGCIFVYPLNCIKINYSEKHINVLFYVKTKQLLSVKTGAVYLLNVQL